MRNAKVVGFCVGIGLICSAALAITPADVSGLVLWLDAGRNVVVGGDSQVTSWGDVTGAVNNATANDVVATEGLGPTVVTGASGIGGKTALYFSNNWLSNTVDLVTPGSARTVFMVAHLDAASSGGEVVAMRLSGACFACQLYKPASINYVYTDASSYNGTIADDLLPLIRSPFISSHMSSGAGGVLTVCINGTNRPVSLAAISTENGTAGFAIGGRNGYRWTGKVAEVVVYNRTLTSTEQDAVGSYLASKYGIGTSYTTVSISDKPASVPGLVLRLDAGWNVAKGTDGRVKWWGDLTDANNNTNAQDVTADAGNGPTVQTGASGIGGQEVLYFFGKTLTNGTDLVAPGSARTVFLVAQTDSGYNGGAPMTMRRSVDFFAVLLSQDSAVNYVYTDGRTYNGTIADDLLPIIRSSFVSSHRSSGAGGLLTVALNGVNRSVSLSAIVAETGDPGFQVGSAPNGTAWIGKIAEMLVYNRSLSPTEQNTVGYYLASKYGIATTYHAMGTIIYLR